MGRPTLGRALPADTQPKPFTGYPSLTVKRIAAAIEDRG
jgi:hypothetical protein